MTLSGVTPQLSLLSSHFLILASTASLIIIKMMSGTPAPMERPCHNRSCCCCYPSSYHSHHLINYPHTHPHTPPPHPHSSQPHSPPHFPH